MRRGFYFIIFIYILSAAPPHLSSYYNIWFAVLVLYFVPPVLYSTVYSTHIIVYLHIKYRATHTVIESRASGLLYHSPAPRHYWGVHEPPS